MYLISQLWWFLLLAFLLGALLGYLLWRACGRRRIETHYERSNNELITRLGALEQERSRFSGAAVDAEGDNAKLKSEIAGLQGKLADTSGRLNAAVDTADAKLKSYVDSVRHREETMGAEIEKLKKEAAEAQKTWEAEKAAAKAREDKLASDAVLAQKSADDVQRKHADDLRASEKRRADDAAKKHADELKKAQENARGEAVAEAQVKHAEELKKVRDEATAAAKRAHDDELTRFKREAVAFVSPAPGPAASPAPSLAQSTVRPVDPAPAAARGKAPGAIAKARSGKADDLKLIWGVGPEIEKILNQNGIYHFDQVAAWTKADLRWFDSISKVYEGRVEREKWVEQSKKLASGWRPEREIGEKPAGLAILTGPRDGKADDLKLIWGVGPKLETMLNGAGFFHFDQILSGVPLISNGWTANLANSPAVPFAINGPNSARNWRPAGARQATLAKSQSKRQRPPSWIWPAVLRSFVALGLPNRLSLPCESG